MSNNLFYLILLTFLCCKHNHKQSSNSNIVFSCETYYQMEKMRYDFINKNIHKEYEIISKINDTIHVVNEKNNSCFSSISDYWLDFVYNDRIKIIFPLVANNNLFKNFTDTLNILVYKNTTDNDYGVIAWGNKKFLSFRNKEIKIIDENEASSICHSFDYINTDGKSINSNNIYDWIKNKNNNPCAVVVDPERIFFYSSLLLLPSGKISCISSTIFKH